MKNSYSVVALAVGLSLFCLAGSLQGATRTVTVTAVTGQFKTLQSATVAFAAADEAQLLFMAWDESDRGDNVNSWRRFRHVTVPAGATAATIVPYESIDTTTTKVRFFFAPLNAALYDATVEYVEATGTQYVDTGVYASGPSTAVEADFAFTHTGTTYEDSIFGATDGNNITAPLNFHFNFRMNRAGTYSFNCKDISHHTGIASVAGTLNRLLVKLDSPGRLLSIYDQTAAQELYSYSIPSEWPHNNMATRTMTIFANNGHEPTFDLAQAKLYSLKIYDEAIATASQPVKSFVPVISDGIGYLVETVAGIRCETLGLGNLVASTTLGENATVTGAISASDALDVFPPVLSTSVVTTSGEVKPERTISYTISTPGFGGSSLKTELLYSLNADYSSATRVTVDAAYAGEFPYVSATNLTGLTQGVPYYAKFIVTSGDSVAVTPFEFVCPAEANRKCVWNVTDGQWGSAANWKVGEVAATYPPEDFDLAVYGGSGAKKVTLGYDQTVSNLYNAVLTSSGGVDGSANVTCDLNGHTLHVKKDVISGRTWIGNNGQLTFTNGTLNVDGNLCASYDSLDWRCGTINFLGSELHAAIGGNFTAGGYGSYSGFNIKDGAVVELAGKLALSAGGQRFHATSPYPGPSFGKIIGKGSRLKVSGSLAISNWARLTVGDEAEFDTFGFVSVDNFKNIPIGNTASYSEMVVDGGKATIHDYPIAIGTATHWNQSTKQSACHNLVEVSNDGQLLGVGDSYIAVGISCNAGCTTNNRLRVSSGGVVDLRQSTSTIGIRVSSGNNPGADRCHGCNGVEVEGGTIYAPALVLGYTECRSNNWLNVSGKAAKIVLSGSVSLKLNYHSTLNFTLDADGFDEVPIQCAGQITATQSQTLAVPSELIIDARAFARKHPSTSVTLIEAQTDSTAALTELMNNATFVCPASRPQLGGILSIVDGKKLVLTTHARTGMCLIIR